MNTMNLKIGVVTLLISVSILMAMINDKCNYIVDVEGEGVLVKLVHNHTSIEAGADSTIHFDKPRKTPYVSYINDETNETKHDEYVEGIWGYSTVRDSTLDITLVRKKLVWMDIVKNGQVTTSKPVIKTYEKNLSIPFSKLPASYEIKFASGEKYKISALKSCD